MSSEALPPGQRLLLIGSGPIEIGQAGEFDYAGAQALKALKQAGHFTLLMNPNLASVQTRPEYCDQLLPLALSPEQLRRVLQQEKPDALLLGFGGQQALNLALALESSGDLTVPLLGTPLAGIRQSEDRQAFAALCEALALPTAPAWCFADRPALAAELDTLLFPLLLRQPYALGGYQARFFESACALWQAELSFPLRLEADLRGWQELEFEVLRDSVGQQIVVCALENIDPLGIHTGDSYVVAPPQTLSNPVYFALRAAALRITAALGLIGEGNVQFALAPDHSRWLLVEVNARLSRSAALAAKATGYPVAWVAARLALGERLDQIPYPLHPTQSCLFEPTLDYLVLKAPRWDFERFAGASRRLGPQMQSTGEGLGFGSDFAAAFSQLAESLAWAVWQGDDTALAAELQSPSDRRLPALLSALQRGWPLSRLQALTGIHPWFLARLQDWLQQKEPVRPPAAGTLQRIDSQAGAADVHAADTRAPLWLERAHLGAMTLPLPADEIHFDSSPPWLLLPGAGPYGIGTSIEFDFCTVSAIRRLQSHGYRVALFHDNPETVSSDSDLADAMIFAPVSAAVLQTLYQRIQPLGLLLSCSGQRPHQLLQALPPALRDSLPIWGTAAAGILQAEDRQAFARRLEQLQLPQPAWTAASQLEAALAFGERVGYPLIYRPGFVLGGERMQRLEHPDQLRSLWQAAGADRAQQSAVLNQWMPEALEFELDGLAWQGQLQCLIWSENLEPAGIHSGDSHHMLPVQRLPPAVLQQAQHMAQSLVAAWPVHGLFNLQFLWHQPSQGLMIMEANLRASRNLPFLSHVTGVNLVERAMDLLCGATAPQTGPPEVIAPRQAGLRCPHFSGQRIDGADSTGTGGVQMRATGESVILAPTLSSALAQAERISSPLRPDGCFQCL